MAKIPTPSGKVPALPKAGVFEERQAKVAARNIVSDLMGGEGVRWDGHGVCFLEIGHGKAGMVLGDFYGESPQQPRMRSPRRVWHWGKILVERHWFGRLFR